MTEEKDFWINKAEVYVLSNAEGTAYKVTQEMMNKRGWYKLADDERVSKKVELTKEEANFVEKHKSLPFYDLKEPLSYIISLHDYVDEKNVEHPRPLLAKLALAYFNGYTIKKEKKYYIELNFNYHNGSYLNVNRFGVWAWGESMEFLMIRKRNLRKQRSTRCKNIRAQKGLILMR